MKKSSDVSRLAARLNVLAMKPPTSLMTKVRFTEERDGRKQIVVADCSWEHWPDYHCVHCGKKGFLWSDDTAGVVGQVQVCIACGGIMDISDVTAPGREGFKYARAITKALENLARTPSVK